ncbi:hypothetical protein ACHAWF_010894 [Thalassiosira exigua]
MRTKESRLRSIAAVVAVLLPLLAIASAAEDVLAITECAAEERDACAATANRTCYLYPNGTHACGNCLNAYFEFEGTCHDIEEVDAEGGFDFLSRLLELYLPEYVDPNVTTDERAEKLKQATKTVSFWMSAIPPPSFELGLTRETFLTDEERRGRLGIRSDLRYDEDSYLSAPGNRGRMERFVVPGSANEGSGEAGDSTRARRMQDVPPPKPAVDWDEEGYVTEVKNQGLCGCCWAVATAAAVESALMITNQTSRYDNLDENSLSFQQMISCDEAESACQGGNIFQAIRYVWEHNDVGNGNFGGLFSYDDWPYTDRMGRATMDCKAQSVKDSGKEPVAYLNFPQMVNSVNDRFTSFEERKNRLMTAVSIQPVISVMKSGCDLFANYDGGVLTHDDDCQCCDVSCIDHGEFVYLWVFLSMTPCVGMVNFVQ